MTKPFVSLKVGLYRVNVQFTAILCMLTFAVFFYALQVLSTATIEAIDLTQKYMLLDGMLSCGAVVCATLIALVTDEFGISITKEE